MVLRVILLLGSTMTPTGPKPQIPVTVIEPSRALNLADAKQMWLRRSVLFALVRRDLAVRYKQTVLGVAWIALQPLVSVGIFTFLLGYVGQVEVKGMPYALFICAGIVPWQIFAKGLLEGSASVTDNAVLVTKVSLPRMFLPAVSSISALVDFAAKLIILIGLMVWFEITPGWWLLFAPLFLIEMLLFGYGIALAASALNVLYRDVRHLLPMVVQFWFFVTPVLYPETVIPLQWRPLYDLNPMAGPIAGFRWAVVGGAPPTTLMIVSSIVCTVGMLVIGFYVFSRLEGRFADRV